MKTILVVDDEIGVRESLKAVFQDEYRTILADSAKAALSHLAKEKIDLIILDVIMPETSGLDLLKEVNTKYENIPVVMVSASTSTRPVVEAMRVGAQDYITKPFDVEELRHTVKRVIDESIMSRRIVSLEQDVKREFPTNNMIGESPAFKAAIQELETAAQTDATILILGESGTGKELAARMVHEMSERKDEPFVAVHCAALPESLMESELFGHEKGAFTNATSRKRGRFDLAGNGTLFFDELGEMSLAIQVKLLRVLQEREYMRVGGTDVIKTNARIVAATSKDLKAEIEKGNFRDDLYFRISVIPIVLPPVRERVGDVPLLIDYFMNEIKKNINAITNGFTEEAMNLLCNYSWPGNVRELRNIIERMLVLYGRKDRIPASALPQEFHKENNSNTNIPVDENIHFSAGKISLQDAVNNYERKIIENALQEADGVQTRAAEILGCTRRILRYRMEKLDLI